MKFVLAIFGFPVAMAAVNSLIAISAIEAVIAGSGRLRRGFA